MHKHLRPAFANQPSPTFLETGNRLIQIIHRHRKGMNAFPPAFDRAGNCGILASGRHHFKKSAIRQLKECLLDAKCLRFSQTVEFQS